MKDFRFPKWFAALTLSLLTAVAAYSRNPDTTRLDTLELLPLFEPEVITASGTPGLARRRIRPVPGETQAALMLDRNGNAWKAWHVDGLKVLLNVRYLQHYGKYYRMDLYIENDSERPVLFDFNNTRLSTLGGPVKVFSHDRYLGRISSRKTWKTIGISVGTMFVALFIAQVLHADDNRGDRDSFGEEILEDIASAAIEEAGYIAAAMVSEREAEDMDRIVRNNIGYLRSCSIPPGVALEGHAYAKYKPGASVLDITLPIGGKDYVFQWDTTDLADLSDEF